MVELVITVNTHPINMVILSGAHGRVSTVNTHPINMVILSGAHGRVSYYC